MQLNDTDKLALVWAVPFVLCGVGLCLAYLLGEETVAASQMLYLVACLGLGVSLIVFIHTLHKRRCRNTTSNESVVATS